MNPGPDPSVAPIRVAGAAGFWGESTQFFPRLLGDDAPDFIVLDYLAEITMSILARARARDGRLGYATDFVTALLAPNLDAIARCGVRIIASAGGVNPGACGEAVRRLVAEARLDLSVAVVAGDDLSDRVAGYAAAGVREAFSDAPFPPCERIASCNAYLGAGPIAAALDGGADIVVTGRVVDSALTLGACLHAFRWAPDDHDRLAAGSLAGHLLECSTQATGGNFTDWRPVADAMAGADGELGYPVATIAPDGRFSLEVAAGGPGQVTAASVAEQVLYEIEDPRAYRLPDVTCDFSRVEIVAAGAGRVAVTGALGHAAPERLKVSATWQDGFRAGQVLFIEGFEAREKAAALADIVALRTSRALAGAGLVVLDEYLVEQLGSDREIALKIAGRHPDARGVAVLLREIVGAALAAPPGLSLFTGGGRPRPSPVVRLFSFLVPRTHAEPRVEVDGEPVAVPWQPVATDLAPIPGGDEPPAPESGSNRVEVPLIELAWARSGDKGNRANIGVIARKAAFLPWIWAGLTPERVARAFGGQLGGALERHWLPGLHAVNFVLHDVLGGGGVASLRNDPQGKAYAQRLLQLPIELPAALLRGPDR